MGAIGRWFGAGLAVGLWAGVEASGARARANLRGKLVLITGGSRGLGLDLARAFGGQGCRVAICARDEGTLAKARAALLDDGVEAQTFPCDVTDKAQVAALIEDVNARMGPIDILVCCAVSSITVGPVAAQSAEDFEATHAVLYWGVVYPTLAVLPQMRARGDGRIVILSSVGGKIAVPHMVAYSGAKFAAVGFAEGLRAELAGTGVSVTTIAPGVLRTGAHLHARYAGNPDQEFAWFSAGELGPAAVDTSRAARTIVTATARRAGEVIFPLSSLVAARLHGAMPNLVGGLSGAVNSLFLPKLPHGEPMRDAGLNLERRARNPVVRLLSDWYHGELRRLNQYPDEPATKDGTRLGTEAAPRW